MSKGSAHFVNEQRKQALVDARVAKLQAQAAALSEQDLARHAKEVDKKVRDLGKRRGAVGARFCAELGSGQARSSAAASRWQGGLR